MHVSSLPIIGPITRDMSSLTRSLTRRRGSSPPRDLNEDRFHYSRPSHVRAWLSSTSPSHAPQPPVSIHDSEPPRRNRHSRDAGRDRPVLSRSKTERQSIRRPKEERRHSATVDIVRAVPGTSSSSRRPERRIGDDTRRKEKRDGTGRRSLAVEREDLSTIQRDSLVSTRSSDEERPSRRGSERRSSVARRSRDRDDGSSGEGSEEEDEVARPSGRRR